MKINNKKIIVSTLALAMGAALAGSISGSVAWYQYSTRAAAGFTGTSAGTSRNLQVAEAVTAGDPAWSNYVDLGTANFRPVSIVADATTNSKSVSAWKEHPVYQVPTLPALTDNEKTYNGLTTVAYAEYKLVFKIDENTNGTAGNVAKDIYLSKLNIVYNGSGNDVTPAVRIAIDGTKDFIVAPTAGATTTAGNLDIGGKIGSLDTSDWDTQDGTEANKITYTSGADQYTAVAPSSVIVDADTNPYSFADANKVLTATKADGSASEEVNIKIWIEGWQPLGTKTVWDNAYMNQNFSVQMQFACEADK